MTTEYRQGIPSVAHVEAATRLGLLWRGSDGWLHRFRRLNDQIEVWYFENLSTAPDWEAPDFAIENLDFRPIRTDGTPVDWEVLDAEAARAAQPIAPTNEDARRLQFAGRQARPAATVTPTASSTSTTQPQGFRADLWRRICEIFNGLNQPSAAGRTDWGLSYIASFSPDLVVIHGVRYQQLRQRASADILTRWTVYQELKPLYDIVDGAQGEAAMPRDVAEALQAPEHTNDLVVYGRDNAGRVCLHLRDGDNRTYSAIARTARTNNTSPIILNERLHDFATVLDTVAEQRVAERQATAAEPTPSVSPLREQQAPQPAAPEPRSFADVRPDRHVHKRWRLFGDGCGNDGCLLEINSLGDRYRTPPEHRWWGWASLDSVWLRRTVIPTDEQGNPVSWESIGQGRGMPTEEVRRIENAVAASVQEQMTRPINCASFSPDLVVIHGVRYQQLTITQAVIGPISFNDHIESGYTVNEKALDPAPLPRFTADELDDVDHSATTTQDSATLKRGKLPTVEAIGKYREVMSKRNGTIAEAVKASGIDCEVAQYVLERWASGLSDREAFTLIADRYIPNCRTYLRRNIDSSIRDSLSRPTLDTSEPADTAAQRQRAEAAERKARMAALQAQLAKERATLKTESIEEPTRFSLLEVDEAADPSKSIEAWKAQRAANERRARSTVRPVTATTPEPTPAPRRKPFEVVDAQADGLSGGAAFAVLLSRAMNQNC